MQPDYYLIPNVVRNHKDLRPSDWMVYAVVYWFEKMHMGKCIASNKVIGECGGMGERAVGAGLERLEAAGFIRRTYKDAERSRRAQIYAMVSFSVNATPSLFGEGSTTVPPARSNKRATSGSTNVPQSSNKESSKTIAATSAAPFSLKDEIKKMEDNPRRDLNIVALYFDERKPKLESREQFMVALRRHLRAAGQLKPFSNEQIMVGVKKAKREYPEWTLETVVKMVTK